MSLMVRDPSATPELQLDATRARADEVRKLALAFLSRSYPGTRETEGG
nr:hypothetical protein JVH1_0669 [Rhodococcus sp. JVH1]